MLISSNELFLEINQLGMKMATQYV